MPEVDPETALVLRFLEYQETERGASPRTVEAYARALTQFRRWLQPAQRAWSECRAEDFRAWLCESTEQQLKPATIRLRFAALRSFYSYLMRREG